MSFLGKVALIIMLAWSCDGKRRQAMGEKDANRLAMTDAYKSVERNNLGEPVEPVDIEDTNMAQVGSDADQEKRKHFAELEPAFEGVGKSPGLWVWRIEKFKVVPWKKVDFGKFYRGDCYIVLKVTKDDVSEKLIYNVYFWLGSASTLDEQGTAAYKAVQLDDLFDGAPTQSREVEGSESRAFSALFPTIQYLEGGVESGFDPIDPSKYKRKMFLVRKTKKNGLKILEVPPSASSMNQGDCFVLDGGQDIRSWCGMNASPHEKWEAGRFGEHLESERLRTEHKWEPHAPTESFWQLLGGKGEIKEEFEEDVLKQPPYGEGVLYRLSHVEDKLEMTEVANGDLTKSMLDSDDVMLVDTTAEVFVWIGKNADSVERRNAMDTAIEYVHVNNMSKSTPIHLFKEGQEINNYLWNKMFAN